MCKKISISHNKWIEVEEWLGRLKPFEADEMPELTHGLCNHCHGAVISQLDDLEPRQKDMNE